MKTLSKEDVLQLVNIENMNVIESFDNTLLSDNNVIRYLCWKANDTIRDERLKRESAERRLIDKENTISSLHRIINLLENK